uniref:Uncharacterized protein n=1 Tax=Anguilla anguilla TaxID=7936 RepID=A0A0E9RTE4_ANGAN
MTLCFREKVIICICTQDKM